MLLEASGYTGRILFDGQTVRVLRDTVGGKVTARANHWDREVKIGLIEIEALRWRSAGKTTNGHLGFELVGYTRIGPFDADKDQHTVGFRTRRREDFEQMRDAIQQALEAHRRHAGQGPQAPPIMGPSGWELAQQKAKHKASLPSPDTFILCPHCGVRGQVTTRKAAFKALDRTYERMARLGGTPVRTEAKCGHCCVTWTM